jgi:hypothetical protein
VACHLFFFFAVFFLHVVSHFLFFPSQFTASLGFCRGGRPAISGLQSCEWYKNLLVSLNLCRLPCTRRVGVSVKV